jgi:excisionase family DNA binding protein
MSVKDAGAYAKVSTQSIRRWIRTGRLKIYRAGRQIRINEADLVDLLSPQELKWW